MREQTSQPKCTLLRGAKGRLLWSFQQTGEVDLMHVKGVSSECNAGAAKYGARRSAGRQGYAAEEVAYLRSPKRHHRADGVPQSIKVHGQQHRQGASSAVTGKAQQIFGACCETKDKTLPQMGRYHFLQLLRNFRITTMHKRATQELRWLGLEIGEQGDHVLRSTDRYRLFLLGITTPLDERTRKYLSPNSQGRDAIIVNVSTYLGGMIHCHEYPLSARANVVCVHLEVVTRVRFVEEFFDLLRGGVVEQSHLRPVAEGRKA
eukprot:3016077-Pyramimonas_sp.AAC.1